MLGKAFAHCPIFPTAASRRSLGRVSVPVWPITLSGRLPIVDLVGRCPANYLMGRERTPHRISPLTPGACTPVVLCGISTCFQVLSPCKGQIAHALLTRPPLEQEPKSLSPLDLHVLGTPPAFVLSQDQTLIFDLYSLKLSLCVYFLSVLESTSLFSTFSCFHRSTFSLPCLFSYVSFSRFVGSQLVSLADS